MKENGFAKIRNIIIYYYGGSGEQLSSVNNKDFAECLTNAHRLSKQGLKEVNKLRLKSHEKKYLNLLREAFREQTKSIEKLSKFDSDSAVKHQKESDRLLQQYTQQITSYMSKKFGA